MNDNTKLAYRVQEVAWTLGCSNDMVWKLLAKGELRGFKIGSARFVSTEELLRFIKAKEAESS